ncbi:hypothetical protein GCM10012275_16920 [Longimycelium tulufanense]|uniref:4-hydroxybenzoate polyprenyltransferase n=1 Tax=Longimycelium tulufanense TaxID=907463 RepID=A0A8J3FTI9_9PSEU|nr:UbiA family prenyltransferase [Longimycelium tulufanense]GGM46495.1 hypothetical protein GCM10012275_16920 [Longimycelium tulufanense]
MSGLTGARPRVARWSDLAHAHKLVFPFPIYYFCHAGWGAGYVSGGYGDVLAVPVVLALTANLLAIVGGAALNATVDFRTDSHNRGKERIARAVIRLGPRNVLAWSAVEIALSLLLAAFSTLLTGNLDTVAAVTLMIALGLLYDLEPVRLKRRGFLNPVALGLSAGLLPAVAIASAVTAHIPAAVWLVFAGLGVLVGARALWWSFPDRHGDLATGMRTPTVRYGTGATGLITAVAAAVGLGLLGWGVWWRYGPAWMVLAVVVGGVFLVPVIAVLCRSGKHQPDAALLRRHHLLLAALADVVLVALPFLA